MNNTSNPTDTTPHFLVSSRGQILEIDRSQLHDYLENNGSFDPWVFDTDSADEAEEKAEENRLSTELYEDRR